MAGYRTIGRSSARPIEERRCARPLPRGAVRAPSNWPSSAASCEALPRPGRPGTTRHMGGAWTREPQADTRRASQAGSPAQACGSRIRVRCSWRSPMGGNGNTDDPTGERVPDGMGSRGCSIQVRVTTANAATCATDTSSRRGNGQRPQGENSMAVPTAACNSDPTARMSFAQERRRLERWP
jgi:hypothetical protein